MSATGVSGNRFNILTDDGSGVERSSEWLVDGSSIKEENEGARSTKKEQLDLQPEDVIVLFEDNSPKPPEESLQSSNR